MKETIVTIKTRPANDIIDIELPNKSRFVIETSKHNENEITITHYADGNNMMVVKPVMGNQLRLINI